MDRLPGPCSDFVALSWKVFSTVRICGVTNSVMLTQVSWMIRRARWRNGGICWMGVSTIFDARTHCVLHSKTLVRWLYYLQTRQLGMMAIGAIAASPTRMAAFERHFYDSWNWWQRRRHRTIWWLMCSCTCIMCMGFFRYPVILRWTRRRFVICTPKWNDDHDDVECGWRWGVFLGDAQPRQLIFTGWSL